MKALIPLLLLLLLGTPGPTKDSSFIHGQVVAPMVGAKFGNPGAYLVEFEGGWHSTPGGLASVEMPANFPPNSTLSNLSGTLAYWSDCADVIGDNQMLLLIYVSSNGQLGYPLNVKGAKGHPVNLFVNFPNAVKIGDGKGKIHIEVVSSPGCGVDVEFQGLVTVQ